MNLAYIIQAHTGENQLISLINQLSDADTDIFLHVDKKNDELYVNLLNYYSDTSNIYFVKVRGGVNWSGFSMVEATLKLMNMVRSIGKKYNYISFISGQDYPIKSNEYIKKYLTENQGKEFIEFRDIAHHFWRLKCYSFFRENKNNRKLYMRILDNVIRYPQKKMFTRNNFKNMKLYYGSTWFTITYDCMLYILSYLQDNPEYIKQYNHTSCSDEHFFQMIVMNSHFKNNVVNNNQRYIDWSNGGNSPKALTVKDYDNLKNSDKLYARKFNYEIDKDITEMLSESFCKEKLNVGRNNMLNNKTILITGGTGSFGKKFTEMILQKYNPRKIIIYSRDEFKQDLMNNEFTKRFPDDIKKLRFFIGDVRDKDRLYRAFDGVDFVIHAAAMKQVPACEYNPVEAIKTNIHGAQNIVEAAIDRGVKKVVALSTDKAVNPINLYGGTKLVSDKLFISANAYAADKGTIFSAVRYGNVAGSRGSVIPFFDTIIKDGRKDLPITDYEMTRFWITLEQGVELVFKALEESKGGETYISKIPSFKITDLAKAMLDDVEPVEVGIREGEKLHEVMVTSDDSRTTYEYDKHYIVYPHFEWWNFETHFTPGGTLIENGFEYNSANNAQWLNVEQLREEMLKYNIYDCYKNNGLNR